MVTVSTLVAVKNKKFSSLAPADNDSSSSSLKVKSPSTEPTTLPFVYEEMEETNEESVTEEQVTEVHTTTTKPTTIKKPTTTKPSTTNPTTPASGKIFYYYTDSTTGYEPSLDAEYYSNGY